MSTTAFDTHGTEHSHGHHPQGAVAWILRWVTTTNHKDIGTLYLMFSLLMFFVGGAMALVIRAELFEPGLQFVNPVRFNQMTTVHALVMVFGMIMPAFAGFANWKIPLMIGAPDMALPRLNNWSFWLLPFAATLLMLTLFLPGGGPASGWTLYDLGPFPALVRAGKGTVVGELYEVDDDLLAQLDRYEGTPSFYRREVIALEDGSTAHAYTLRDDQVRGRAIVKGGDWCARRNK